VVRRWEFVGVLGARWREGGVAVSMMGAWGGDYGGRGAGG